MNQLELTLADGRALDIPAASISCFEAMHVGKNPTFPDARCFIRYSFGEVDRTAVLEDSFDSLARLLDVHVRPKDWVLLTREDGDRVALQSASILSREEVAGEGAGACKLVIAYGIERRIGELVVRDTRDEVKALMEHPDPEPVTEPVETPPVRKPRRGK